MHVKTGFFLKKIADAYSAIPYDSNYDAFGAIVSMNYTGAFLWQCLEEDIAKADLVVALQKEYGIKEDVAEQAVASFLEMLREHQLLEE